MQKLELPSNNQGLTVREQLVALGYEIYAQSLPKVLVKKDGNYFWVMTTPLFRGRKFTEEQEATIKLLEKDIGVLAVIMPK